MTEWASILSTIAGAAMFFSKSKAETDNGNGGGKNNTSTITDLDPTEASYQEYKQKVEEAQAQQQANDPRGSRMYYGDPTAPYDPFYDYSDEGLYTPSDLENPEYPTKACRVRFVSPYLLSEEVMKNGTEDEKMGVIGCNEKTFLSGMEVYENKQYGLNNLFRRYSFFLGDNKLNQAEVDGYDQFVMNIARGNTRYVTFYLEVFNPCKKDVEIQTFGIENVKVGDTECQPIHLGGMPRDFMMGKSEQEEKLYMYSSADRDGKYGNKGFFAFRELRTEPITSNGRSTTAKLLKAGYSYIACDNIANNGYAYQDWTKVYDGFERTGWATIAGKKETTLVENGGSYKSEEYKPSYLKVAAQSSRIVKMTLPLASLTDTKVYYAPEGELFDWDFRKGEIEKIHSYLGIANSEFVGQENIVGYSEKLELLSKIARQYYTTLHQKGVTGYLRYDIKPAPSLVGKVFSLKLHISGNQKDYIPSNDPYTKGTSASTVVSFELKFVPTARPNNMKNEWRNAYIDDRTIPAEDQSRLTQLGLINNKFDYKYEQTFSDAFDASANN